MTMTTNTNQNLQYLYPTETNLAHNILQQLFKQYENAFTIKLWDNSSVEIGHGVPAFKLSILNPGLLYDLILIHDPVRLAEAYFDGEIEVEGDFNVAMGLRYYFENLQLPLKEKLSLALRALTITKFKLLRSKLINKSINFQRRNGKESIAFHYDISNEFYQIWLDQKMLYSCAYFETPDQSLDQAQTNKLNHICRKLRLRPGESLLDVGCGWGALACFAAKYYGVTAYGITLSQNQYEYANEEIRRQGLEGQVVIELRDYRELSNSKKYDKISSIGMFEHVGLKNLPEYFSTIHGLLKPGGLFLNHGITSDEPGWDHSVSTRFINRHIFPDGELDTISNVQGLMEDAKFEIFDVEGLRPHYALTLRHWISRLESRSQEVIRAVGERTYRIWRLYMTGSALQFELGSTGIYQILAVRKETGLPHIPLTRQDLYSK